MIGEDSLEKRSKNYALTVSILLLGTIVWFMAETTAPKVKPTKEDIAPQKVLCYLASFSERKEVKKGPVKKPLTAEKPESRSEKKRKITPPLPEPSKVEGIKELPKITKKEVKQESVKKPLPVEKPKSRPEKKRKITPPRPEPSRVERVKAPPKITKKEEKQKPTIKPLPAEKPESRPGEKQNITSLRPETSKKVAVAKSESTVQKTGRASPNKATPQDKRRDLRETLLAKILALIEKEKFYPPLAKRLGLEGRVTLQIVVDRNGRISKVEILNTKGHSLLKKGALKTMERVSRHFLGVELSEPLTLKISIQYLLKERR